ncbi:hypothetical protein AQV86_02340 [Nanohaloarchaea archaeon SG9]|nr:hypothetical protein AQV86_02340 [Nanohaloarchaea archaeon SG9]
MLRDWPATAPTKSNNTAEAKVLLRVLLNRVLFVIRKLPLYYNNSNIRIKNLLQPQLQTSENHQHLIISIGKN